MKSSNTVERNMKSSNTVKRNLTWQEDFEIQDCKACMDFVWRDSVIENSSHETWNEQFKEPLRLFP